MNDYSGLTKLSRKKRYALSHQRTDSRYRREEPKTKKRIYNEGDDVDVFISRIILDAVLKYKDLRKTHPKLQKLDVFISPTLDGVKGERWDIKPNWPDYIKFVKITVSMP